MVPLTTCGAHAGDCCDRSGSVRLVQGSPAEGHAAADLAWLVQATLQACHAARSLTHDPRVCIPGVSLNCTQSEAELEKRARRMHKAIGISASRPVSGVPIRSAGLCVNAATEVPAWLLRRSMKCFHGWWSYLQLALPSVGACCLEWVAVRGPHPHGRVVPQR